MEHWIYRIKLCSICNNQSVRNFFSSTNMIHQLSVHSFIDTTSNATFTVWLLEFGLFATFFSLSLFLFLVSQWTTLKFGLFAIFFSLSPSVFGKSMNYFIIWLICRFLFSLLQFLVSQWTTLLITFLHLHFYFFY
jgi:hypothetical protein